MQNITEKNKCSRRKIFIFFIFRAHLLSKVMSYLLIYLFVYANYIPTNTCAN